MSDFNPDSFVKEYSSAEAQVPDIPTSRANDFNPDEFIDKSLMTESAPQPGMVVPAYYAPIETGINPNAIKQVAGSVYQAYKSNPVGGLADAVLIHAGIPPVYGSAKALEAGFTTASKLASQFADVADTQKYFDLWKTLDQVDPGIGAKISDIYRNQGGGNAVKNWLTSSDEGRAFLANPKTTQIAEQYIGAVPSTMQQVGRVVGPIARGALKVAGPVGTAYDVYEAGKFAQESKLGQRLAEGQAQQAPQAYQNLAVNQNVSGYQPNPQEAANLLASGDARTIQMYGGAQRLAGLAAQTQPQPQPVNTNWIDNALNTFRKYRGVIGQ